MMITAIGSVRQTADINALWQGRFILADLWAGGYSTGWVVKFRFELTTLGL